VKSTFDNKDHELKNKDYEYDIKNKEINYEYIK